MTDSTERAGLATAEKAKSFTLVTATIRPPAERGLLVTTLSTLGR